MNHRMAIGLVVLLAGWAAVVPGCGDDSTSQPDDGATEDVGADADADADGDADAGGDADADADVEDDGETTPDDGGGTGTLLVTVRGPRICPDWTRNPIAGAAVAFDPPGGARVEATTDAAGQALFEGIDWSAGTGAATAWKEGYGLGSTVGIDGSAAEVNVILPVGDTTSPACVTLSGHAQNMVDEAHYVVIGEIHSPDTTWTVGPDWTAQVAPGVPLTLFAIESITRMLGGPQVFTTTNSAWLILEHAAITTDTTFEFDFADSLTPTAVEGSVTMPAGADNPLRTLYLTPTVVASVDPLAGQTYPMAHGIIGMASHGEPSADGNTMTYGIEHLTPAGVTDPVTIYSLSAWATPVNPAGAAIYVRGYPVAGAQDFTFLDAARLTSPPDSTTHHPLHTALEWEPPLADLIPWMLLYRGVTPSTGMVWMLTAPAGSTSLVIPEPPSAVPVATVLGTSSIRGYLRVVHETPADDCFVRYSDSEYFILDLP